MSVASVLVALVLRVDVAGLVPVVFVPVALMYVMLLHWLFLLQSRAYFRSGGPSDGNRRASLCLLSRCITSKPTGERCQESFPVRSVLHMVFPEL